jgi:hypothetical protein
MPHDTDLDEVLSHEMTIEAVSLYERLVYKLPELGVVRFG